MKPAPWAFAAPWGARGYVSNLDGPVHWVEFGSGDSNGSTPIVFVHGLGGSHLNWCLVGPKLAEDRRAVALDLHGFGLTPGGRLTSTVQRNARLLEEFVREVTGTPVILVGNSMGGLISILHTASIALAAERQNHDHADAAAFLAAARSLMRVAGQRRRYWEMMAAVQVPVLLIGGEDDRLVPAASIRQAAARNPRWETVILPGVGHTPQLEVPDNVIGTIRAWLGQHFAS